MYTHVCMCTYMRVYVLHMHICKNTYINHEPVLNSTLIHCLNFIFILYSYFFDKNPFDLEWHICSLP